LNDINWSRRERDSSYSLPDNSTAWNTHQGMCKVTCEYLWIHHLQHVGGFPPERCKTFIQDFWLAGGKFATK